MVDAYVKLEDAIYQAVFEYRKFLEKEIESLRNPTTAIEKRKNFDESQERMQQKDNFRGGFRLMRKQFQPIMRSIWQSYHVMQVVIEGLEEKVFVTAVLRRRDFETIDFIKLLYGSLTPNVAKFAKEPFKSVDDFKKHLQNLSTRLPQTYTSYSVKEHYQLVQQLIGSKKQRKDHVMIDLEQEEDITLDQEEDIIDDILQQEHQQHQMATSGSLGEEDLDKNKMVKSFDLIYLLNPAVSDLRIKLRAESKKVVKLESDEDEEQRFRTIQQQLVDDSINECVLENMRQMQMMNEYQQQTSSQQQQQQEMISSQVVGSSQQPSFPNTIFQQQYKESNIGSGNADNDAMMHDENMMNPPEHQNPQLIQQQPSVVEYVNTDDNESTNEEINQLEALASDLKKKLEAEEEEKKRLDYELEQTRFRLQANEQLIQEKDQSVRTGIQKYDELSREIAVLKEKKKLNKQEKAIESQKDGLSQRVVEQNGVMSQQEKKELNELEEQQHKTQQRKKQLQEQEERQRIVSEKMKQEQQIRQRHFDRQLKSIITNFATQLWSLQEITKIRIDKKILNGINIVDLEAFVKASYSLSQSNANDNDDDDENQCDLDDEKDAGDSAQQQESPQLESAQDVERQNDNVNHDDMEL